MYKAGFLLQANKMLKAVLTTLPRYSMSYFSKYCSGWHFTRSPHPQEPLLLSFILLGIQLLYYTLQE